MMEHFVAHVSSNRLPENAHQLALRLGQSLVHLTHLPTLVQQITEVVGVLVPAAQVTVYRLNDEEDSVVRLLVRQPVRSGVSSYLVEDATRDPLVLRAIEARNAAFEMTSLEGESTQRLCLPLIFREHVLGVVGLAGVDAEVDRTELVRVLDTLLAFAASAMVPVSMREKRDVPLYTDHQLQQVRLAAMSELAAAVAHQLNNPLTTILADTEILLLDTPRDTAQSRSLEAVSRAGKRAAAVVHRLMAVSHPSKLDGMPQAVDLVKTVENVLQLVQSYIETEQIEIRTTFEADIPPIWVVPDTLDDVWFNLLINARDALVGVTGGVIGIEVWYQADREQVCVQIWDNGLGVPDADKARIFEPFHTTRASTERLGLGLHISKQIVERVGGAIYVYNREPKGACFRVVLPVQ